MDDKVLITGLGVVSCIGTGVGAFDSALRAGVTGRSRVESFDTTGFNVHYACEVKDFEASKWLRRIQAQDFGRSAQLAASAARMALDDAGLGATDLQNLRTASIMGTTDGESVPLERIGQTWYQRSEVVPDELSKLSAQNIALAVNYELDLSGETYVVATACAAGNYAIAAGYDLIRTGDADIVFCGGSDSVCRKTFAGFHRLGTLASEHCRPFDAEREGILTGEGSAVLVLESARHAAARGANVYAEVLGYGLNCDADHMVSPNRAGIAECMRLGHRNAGIRAEDVDYICVHGTGTRANDVTEAAAIRSVFANPPPVGAIKSMLGHGMGAASAFGAVACCLGIKYGYLPPTTNMRAQDPECQLNIVLDSARIAQPKIVQNNAFAFGGNNAIVLFGLVA
jgi:3-oxoacyl-[acyl-carrier-protein] synthase II